MEPERYAVTLRHTDGTGNPATRFYTTLIRTDMYDERYVGDQPSTITYRLPRATYLISSVVTTDADTPQQRQSLFAYPLLTVDRDVTVDLDARQAQPVRFSVPDAAEPMAVNVGFDSKLAWTTYSWQLLDGSGNAVTSQHLGAKPDKDHFVGRVEAVLGTRDASGSFANSPYRYNLAWYTPRQLPTGFTGTVRRDDLAKVSETYLTAGTGMLGEKINLPFPTVNDWISPGWVYSGQLFEMPARSTEYYAARDVRWQQSMYQMTPQDEQWLNQSTSEPIGYRAGRTYEQRWNGAVVAPAAWATR